MFRRNEGKEVNLPKNVRGPQLLDLYGPSLIHQTHRVIEQAACSLYTLRRTGFYVRKVTAAFRTCSNEIHKLTMHEMSKSDVKKDVMVQHAYVYKHLRIMFGGFCNEQSKLADALTSRVVEPILALFNECDKDLKAITAQHVQLQARMKALRASVRKQRADCLRAWQALYDADWVEQAARANLQTAERELDDTMGSSELTEKAKKKQVAKCTKLQRNALTRAIKAEQDMHKRRAVVGKKFADFEAAVKDANRQLRLEHTEWRPELLRKLERLEHKRLACMKHCTQEAAAIYGKFGSTLPPQADLLADISRMLDPRTDMTNYVDSQLSIFGRPREPKPFRYALPCTSSLVENDPASVRRLCLEEVSSLVERVGRQETSGKPIDDIVSILVAEERGEKAPVRVTLTDEDKAVFLTRGVFGFPGKEPGELAVAPGKYLLVMDTCPADPVVDHDMHWIDPADLSSDDDDDEDVTVKSKHTADLVDPSTVERKQATEPLEGKVHPTAVCLTEQTDEQHTHSNGWWYGVATGPTGPAAQGVFPGGYTRPIVPTTKSPLILFLHMPTAKQFFASHLESEYSIENLDFWDQCNQYKWLWMVHANHYMKPDGSARTDGYHGVFGPIDTEEAKHLRERERSLRLQVNVGASTKYESGSTVVIAEAKVPHCVRAMADSIVHDFVTSTSEHQLNIIAGTQKQILEQHEQGRYTLGMFDAAQDEIYNMMRADSYSRFKKTQEFKGLLRALAAVSPAVNRLCNIGKQATR